MGAKHRVGGMDLPQECVESNVTCEELCNNAGSPAHEVSKQLREPAVGGFGVEQGEACCPWGSLPQLGPCWDNRLAVRSLECSYAGWEWLVQDGGERAGHRRWSSGGIPGQAVSVFIAFDARVPWHPFEMNAELAM